MRTYGDQYVADRLSTDKMVVGRLIEEGHIKAQLTDHGYEVDADAFDQLMQEVEQWSKGTEACETRDRFELQDLEAFWTGKRKVNNPT